MEEQDRLALLQHKKAMLTGSSEEGNVEEKKKAGKEPQKKKAKDDKAAAQEDAGSLDLVYTPLVWTQVQGVMGDVPSPRSYHTATAVSASVHAVRRHRGGEKEDEDEKEEEEKGMGCEQILIIGGKTEEDSDCDVYLFKILDDENIHSTLVEVSGKGPEAIESHTADLLPDGRTVLVFGGFVNNIDASNEVYLLDVGDMRWYQPTIEGVKPPPRFSHATVLVGPHLFLFGGQDPDQHHNDLWVLDTQAWKWHPLKVESGEVPEARFSHSFVQLPSSDPQAGEEQEVQLLMFGGANMGTNDSDAFVDECFTDLWVLAVPIGWHPRDAHSLHWVEIVDKINFGGVEREGHTATFLGPHLVVLGGSNARGKKKPLYNQNCAWFNPASFRFLEGEKSIGSNPEIKGHSSTLLHMPFNRAAMTRSLGGSFPYRIFVFGGEDSASVNSKCFVVTRAKTVKTKKISAYLDFEQYYNHEYFSDIVLRIIETNDDDTPVKETKFYGQKSILGVRCEYFGKMFASGMKEALSKEVEVRGVQWELFECMLRHIYKLGLPKGFSATDAVQLWKLCDHYALRNLKSICINIIRDAMTIEDFANTYWGGRATVYLELEKGLREICMEFIAGSPEQLEKLTPQFALAMITEMYDFFGNNRDYPSRALLYCLQYHCTWLPILEFALNFLYLEDIRNHLKANPAKKMTKQLALLAITKLLERNLSPRSSADIMEASMSLVGSLLRYVVEGKSIIPHEQPAARVYFGSDFQFSLIPVPKRVVSRCHLDRDFIKLLVDTMLGLAESGRKYYSNAEDIISVLGRNETSLCLGMTVLLQSITQTMLSPATVSFATRLARNMGCRPGSDAYGFSDLPLAFSESIESATRGLLSIIDSQTTWQGDMQEFEKLHLIPALKSLRNLQDTTKSWNVFRGVTEASSLIKALLETVQRNPASDNVRLWAERIVNSICRKDGDAGEDTTGQDLATLLLLSPLLDTLINAIRACQGRLAADSGEVRIGPKPEHNDEVIAAQLEITELLQGHGLEGTEFGWQCATCTLVNSDDRTRCEVCDSEKPTTQQTSLMREKIRQLLVMHFSSTEKEPREGIEKESSVDRDQAPPESDPQKSQGDRNSVANELQYLLSTYATLIEFASFSGRNEAQTESIQLAQIVVDHVQTCWPELESLSETALRLLYILARCYAPICHHLESVGLHWIIDIMNAHPTSPELQAFGLKLISCSLINGSKGLTANFVSYPKNILTLLNALANVQGYYDNTFKTALYPLLAIFTNASEGAGDAARGLVVLNFIQDILAATEGRASIPTLTQITAALASFCLHDNGILVARGVVVKLLQEILDAHISEPSIIINCCQGLTAIEKRTKISAMGPQGTENTPILHSLPSMLNILRMYREDQSVTQAVVSVFKEFIFMNEVNGWELATPEVLELLTELMSLPNQDPGLVEDIEHIMKRLASPHFS